MTKIELYKKLTNEMDLANRRAGAADINEDEQSAWQESGYAAGIKKALEYLIELEN